MPADTLKIVYKGKTVTNEDTIEKLGIKETDFIVVMAQVQVHQPICRNRSLSLRKRPNKRHPRNNLNNKLKNRKPKKYRIKSNRILQPVTLRTKLKLLSLWAWDSPETSVSKHYELPSTTWREQLSIYLMEYLLICAIYHLKISSNNHKMQNREDNN